MWDSIIPRLLLWNYLLIFLPRISIAEHVLEHHICKMLKWCLFFLAWSCKIMVPPEAILMMEAKVTYIFM